jgi:hypothetical protein
MCELVIAAIKREQDLCSGHRRIDPNVSYRARRGQGRLLATEGEPSLSPSIFHLSNANGCGWLPKETDMSSTSKKSRGNPVMPLAAITLRFPDGSWEYCATERVPEAGDTLVRAGVTWIVVGVTEAVDDHRVVTMAAPAPEIRLPSVATKTARRR